MTTKISSCVNVRFDICQVRKKLSCRWPFHDQPDCLFSTCRWLRTYQRQAQRRDTPPSSPSNCIHESRNRTKRPTADWLSCGQLAAGPTIRRDERRGGSSSRPDAAQSASTRTETFSGPWFTPGTGLRPNPVPAEWPKQAQRQLSHQRPASVSPKNAEQSAWEQKLGAPVRPRAFA
jgi:hypothetical protein